MRRSPLLVAIVAGVVVAAALAASPQVVPSLNQRPAKVASNPPLAAPCRALDLHAHLFLQGATGSLVGGVNVQNAGQSACSLIGWPVVSLKGMAAVRERWRVKKLAAAHVSVDVLADPIGSLGALQPGKSATVTVFWSNWCGAPPRALALRLASGTTIRVQVRGAPRCDAPQYPSTVSIGPFTPTPRYLPESSRLPLRAVIVGSRPVPIKPGLRAFRVRRGQQFRFEVAVTNTGEKAFHFAASSCPSYIEQFQSAAAQAYVLNCRPVGAIAPHGEVRFEMRIAIPATARLGNNSLTWQLAPRIYQAPFTAAALWVVAPRPELRWLHMVDASRGYALSGEDPERERLLSTSDGGRHWRDITPNARPTGPVSVVGKTILFSTSPRQRVFAVERSDDGGRTWRRSLPFRDAHGLGAGQPLAVDGRHLYLAVDEGAAAGSQAETLFTSSDGGARWLFISRTTLSYPPRGALPFGCDKSGFGFATPARGWAGGYCAGGLPFSYRTDDGGRTWRRQSLPVPSQCACETSAPRFFTPTTGALYVLGFTTNGSGKPFARVLWTRDAGIHWRGSDPPLGRARQVSFAGARTVWITGQRRGNLRAPFDLLVRSDDAGRHWQTSTLPFDAGSYSLDAVSATVAYAFREAETSERIVVTRDGGRTWRAIDARLS